MIPALEAVTAGLGWPVTGLLLTVSFASSFITAAFGIGGGIAMLTALASLLPVPAVIPVHGVVQLGSNAGRLVVFRRHLLLPVLAPFVLGSLAGVALGGSVVVSLSAGMLQLALGLFILATVWLPPPAMFRRSALLVGAFSSFLTMFFGGTGPFVAAFVKAQEPDRMHFVGSHAMLMTVQHLLKSLFFGLFGFAFGHWMPLIAALIATGFLGTLAGRRALVHIDEALFQRVLTGILTVLALRLIWVGVSELAGVGP